MLYVQPEFGERVRTIAPTYGSFEDASRGLESTLRAGGRRFDAALSREALAFSFAALEVLVAADLDASMERAADLAEAFASGLSEAGYTVAPRGRSTLVAFEYPDPAEARQRLADAGIAVRDLPGFPYLRASVGAWNDESDLQKLLAAL
jgi:L-cysteine/cystine lyase